MTPREEHLEAVLQTCLDALEWAYKRLKDDRYAMVQWKQWCEDEVCPAIEDAHTALGKRSES